MHGNTAGTSNPVVVVAKSGSTAISEPEEPSALWPLVSQYSAGLPAVSRTVFRLNELLSVTPVDLRAVIETVRRDPSVAARVLQMVAEVSGTEDSYCTLGECIVLLGISRLRNLVLTTPMAPSDPLIATQIEALWQHSRLASQLAERVAHECGHPEPERAAIAGLLHDIGKFPQLLAASADSGHSGLPLHCQIGARLATVWKLPLFLIDAIENHHAPAASRRDPFIVSLTAVADEVCLACGVTLQSACISPALTFDCKEVLTRHLPCLSEVRKTALAEALQSEFMRWVNSPSTVDEEIHSLPLSNG